MALRYRLSFLHTEGDVLTLSDEFVLDVTEAWYIEAKSITVGMLSSWKGQLSIVPNIEGQQTSA